MVELLSPVGDFDCLKAAVQNGANAVYFGANIFSARAFATNFDDRELENAINYAKIRGVKTHLTLNTLIKNEEFEDAFKVAKKAYEAGIDAIIVQDLGLAQALIKAFPDIEIHASTQMTTTNLEQVKRLQKLGFKRVVLSRECSLQEIKNICENSDIEIEVFIHGALCICYSGQCLFSSMVGGRSGNRGACAQPCRLPYSLISVDENVSNFDSVNTHNSKILDKGYLLSTRDLCSLENLPDLIKCGVSSFKIEGRMKSPTYVATVTRIYRKYIDLAIKFNKKEIDSYKIDEQDKNDLMQVFNRGNFSTGHLLDKPNKDLIFPQKPNNMGIYLGKVTKHNQNKGLISAKLSSTLCIGDGISLENENTKYTVSELMLNGKNIKNASENQTVTFGRMKGNINVRDKVYKITSKELSSNAIESFGKDYKKTYLACSLKIHKDSNIKVLVKSLAFNLEESFEFDYIPDIAKNAPITEVKIKEQFNKTLNTCFDFSNIEIDLDENLFIPTSIINEIRRQAISKIESKILNSFKRTNSVSFKNAKETLYLENKENLVLNVAKQDFHKGNQEKSILLNVLHTDYEYSDLKPVDRIYIPLKYFADKKYSEIINILSTKSKLYIYLPVIIKDRFFFTIKNIVESALKNYKIYGCVISELSTLEFLKDLKIDIIANYTFNVYNSCTAQEINKLGFSAVTLSPELEEKDLSSFDLLNKEIIVYGKVPLMTMSYCPLGKSNKCYENCKNLCLSKEKFYLNDRYNFKFRVIPDNVQTLTTIYNSRNIKLNGVQANFLRYDFLDETIEEINEII